MKALKNIGIATLFFLNTSLVFANIKIKDVKYSEKNEKVGRIIIEHEGGLKSNPELTIRDKMIQVAIPNSMVWPKIEKKISVGQSPYDTTLSAYQFNKEIVRVRANLPYDLNGKEGLVSILLRDGEIELLFPKSKEKKSNILGSLQKDKIKGDNSAYDESYLERLLKDKEETKQEVVQVDAGKNEKKKDEVKTVLSANQKEEAPKSQFSIASYVGKFVAFLGIILLLFYVVMALMRKGVLKKGKLGFLNSEKSVEVLSTTFVGPKKNLLLVRAHKQVFLIATSEKGVHYLSEVNDTAGLIKDGEKKIAGSNFDTTLNGAEVVNKEFKLKKEYLPVPKKNNKNESLSDLLGEKNSQDRPKLSEQIKSKVKNLKSLQ